LSKPRYLPQFNDLKVLNDFKVEGARESQFNDLKVLNDFKVEGARESQFNYLKVLNDFKVGGGGNFVHCWRYCGGAKFCAFTIISVSIVLQHSY